MATNGLIYTWDLHLVQGLLSPDEAALVLSIPLSHTPVEEIGRASCRERV